MARPSLVANAIMFSFLLFRSPAIAGPPPDVGADSQVWSHSAPIVGHVQPGRGLAEFFIPPEVFDLGRPDLTDLRIRTTSGNEVGYVVVQERGETGPEALRVDLYNRTSVPRETSSVVADFGEKARKTRIEVDTAGTDFRRSIVVEGSDDGVAFRPLRRSALLFRVTGGFEKAAVDLPDNDFRYLRVTVFNGPDDPDVIEIRQVRSWKTVRTETATVSVPVIASEVKARSGNTDILLDLGFRNMPLHRVTLSFSDENFWRRVVLSGRNAEERKLTTRTEDGAVRETVEDEPWVEVRPGTIYRFSGGGETESSSSIDVTGAHFRYLRIRVMNGSDPPLRFAGAFAERLLTRVAFQPREEARYVLLVGNPLARRPSYDLEHYAERLRLEGVSQVRVGALDPIPPGAGDLVVPWSERNKALLWVALGVVFLVLGLLVWTQLRKRTTGPSSP